jgi:hypothetical protein
MKGGETTMKKVLIAVLMVSLVVIGYGIADAAVQGQCSNCHTMHNSQNGSPEAIDDAGVLDPTPRAQLTKASCLGCHNGALSIPAYTQPDVVLPMASGNQTAAGAFDTTGLAATQHNVRDLTWTNDELAVGGLLNVTPGNPGDSPITINGAAQLDCAGATGCHGNHDAEGSDVGINGYHHGSTAYRFLTYGTATTPVNIESQGSLDWETGNTEGPVGSTNHNVYLSAAADDDGDVNTISAFCSNCHGIFHGESDTTVGGLGVVWNRHPTETDFNGLTGGTGITTDYITNPIGFSGTDYTANTPGIPYQDVTVGRVVCVSCHRAHATDQNDILRFSYATQDAGGGGTTGCLGCHISQR